MPEKPLPEKIPLTLQLPADLARRLMATAETRKKSAAELAVELLDNNLPRLRTDGPKGKIPYM